MALAVVVVMWGCSQTTDQKEAIEEKVQVREEISIEEIHKEEVHKVMSDMILYQYIKEVGEWQSLTKQEDN